MEVLKIYDEKFLSVIKNDIKTVKCESNEAKGTFTPEKHSQDRTTLSCSHCQAYFDGSLQQREHYKLDWHRYNLRQTLRQKPPITEEEFADRTDDISSISGSDSEKEESVTETLLSQAKILLQSHSGHAFSLYASLLLSRKEDQSNEVLSQRLRTITTNQKMAVLMLGGGHFAGAVFNKTTPILHKTFHCYTVRAGQGSGQSARDNKSGGSQPRSAGASLRRYNEQALVQHVREVMEAWRKELNECGLVFYRAAGPYNRAVLFGGAEPLLERGDSRIRAVPFSTRRATFGEVQRVHALLTQVFLYTNVEVALEMHFHKKNESKRGKIKSPCIDRAKSREVTERPLPCKEESSESEEEGEMCEMEQEVSFEDLQEFNDSLTPEERKKIKRKKKPKKSKAKKEREEEEKRKKELSVMISSGDIEALSHLLEKVLDNELKVKLVNEEVDFEGNTPLHLAAAHEQNKMLDYLLSNEGNPCCKNQKQQTPYTCTQSKEIREQLKQFARDFPEKFNYNKAQIPTNALTQEELNERRKAQKKVKKEKEKIKKKENEIKKKEETEKERFLKLSDREKRALAAERRILTHGGAVLARCFLCAGDMTGKVPFEYLGNRFCSVDCLKSHRLQNPVILS